MKITTDNPWKYRCWLLTSPRSGSTYLQYLLNLNAGVPLAPSHQDRYISRFSFGEHLSFDICKSWADFEELDPIVSKVHCHQFGNYFLPRRQLKQQFEPIRFVLLERRNEYAQAASLALSNLSKIHHCSNSERLEHFRTQRYEVRDDDLIATLAAVRQYLSFWRNWLHSEPHLVVTYESLIATPRETVAQILDFLSVPHGEIQLDVPLFQLGHPQTEELIERVRRLDEDRASGVSSESALAP